MVGQRIYSTTNAPSLTLESLIPKNNFYRYLKQILDLSFLYEAVKPYYGKCGQKSIDPVVFFKLLLVGHFENLTCDRAIIRSSGLRLDILYFLNYKVGDPLPCHSTLSRTRKRLPISIFKCLLEKIVGMCVEKGMVGGEKQVIDGAFIEANASLHNLQRKANLQWTLLEGELKEKEYPQNKEQHAPFSAIEKISHPKRSAANNATYQSTRDPQARLAQKSGKPFRFYYLSSMAVDTYRHIITHIQADYADERDSFHLLAIVDKLTHDFKKYSLPIKYIIADANFGSGINFALLESYGLTAYIPLHGSYQPIRPGFTYHAQQDVYVCSQGKPLLNRGIRFEKGYANYYYYSRQSDCTPCPVKQACVGNRKKQRLAVTAYRNQYQRMQQRLESKQGRKMKKVRMATVEPVFGSLINYYGMKRVNAKGKGAAHKMMLMAASAYNLKKIVNSFNPLKANTQVLPTAKTNPFYYWLMSCATATIPF